MTRDRIRRVLKTVLVVVGAATYLGLLAYCLKAIHP